jgi:hypothetical protein
MLHDRKQLPQLRFMKHRHDDFKDYLDYEKVILKQSLSSYMFQNDLMNTWLLSMQPLISLLLDQMNVMRNFKNYMVDKYHHKHSK